MRLAQDPRVSKVMVFKRTPDERWKRVPSRWDLEPPFDPDLEPLFEEYGDGGYRFVAVVGGKLAGTYTYDILGYGYPRVPATAAHWVRGRMARSSLW